MAVVAVVVAAEAEVAEVAAAVVAAVAAAPVAVVAVVVAAADAGKALRLRLKQQEAPRCASAAGLLILSSRSPFSSRARRLLTRDARISRFTAQTLHRFGAMTMYL